MRGARSVYEPGATHTRARLTFYSFGGDGFSGTVEGEDPEFGKLISVSTTKAMGAVKGTFQIAVKKPQETGVGEARSWQNLWRDPEGTWVLIQWVCDGQIIDGMLGQIDSINETTMRQGTGARSESYTISGSDFGRVFELAHPLIKPYDDPGRLPFAPLLNRLQSTLANAPPGDWVEALVEAWIGNYESRALLVHALPPGFGADTFYDILQRHIGCRNRAVDGWLQDPRMIDFDSVTGDASLWDMMSNHANTLLNELFCDLAPPSGEDANALTGLSPTITLRRKPFKARHDSVRWDQLLTHDLKPEDLKTRSVAKGGPAQRFNYWDLRISGSISLDISSTLYGSSENSEPGYPGGFPIWNLTSIERHGLRLWQQSTNFTPLGAQQEGGDFARQAAEWLRRCHDWHSVGPYELSGTLSTSRLRPEIRIGQAVKEHHIDGHIEYYVESVQNSWTYGGAGETQITVSRGEYEGDELLDIVYDELELRVEVGEVRRVSEGVGFTTTGDDDTSDVAGELTSEGAQRRTTRGFQRSFQDTLDAIDALTPSEENTRRAFDGEQVQELDADGLPPADMTFTEEDLETGAPIPVDDMSSGLDFSDSDDPLYGLPE